MASKRYARIIGKSRPRASFRAPWLKLAEAARLLAARADGTGFEGEGVQRGDLLADMRLHRRQCLSKDFPVQHASAISMAGAFCAAVDGFLEASPERRTAYAPVLSAASRVVTELLDEQRADDAAATWQRHLPASERV